MIGTTATTACGFDGCTAVLACVMTAGMTALFGRFEIRQQEPPPVGISETCMFVICRMCICIIIIGQCSPPQWTDFAPFGLQFATAINGDPKSASAANNATNLKRHFTGFESILYSDVVPACDVHHTVRWTSSQTKRSDRHPPGSVFGAPRFL